MTIDPPNPPYLGPAAHTMAGHNKPIRRIVIHSTVSPCVEGGARAIATYFRSPSAGGSAHYVVDPGEVVQVVYDDTIAWHAPPNPNSIGIELCDYPSSTSIDHWKDVVAAGGDPQHDGGRKSPLRWLERNHRRMLRRAARLVAELALAYDVPIAFLTVDQVLAGQHGITTHNNVSQAFHQSTHWDPGLWPKRAFMRAVREEVAKLQAKAAR